jgi:hypothetical protein
MPLFVEHPNRNGFIGASGIGELANILIPDGRVFMTMLKRMDVES